MVLPLQQALEVLLPCLPLLFRARRDALAQCLELLLLSVQQLAFCAEGLLLALLLGVGWGVGLGVRG